MRIYPDSKKPAAARQRGAGPVIVAGVSVSVAVFLGVGAAMFLRAILSPWWMPLAGAFVIALASALALQRATAWVTGSKRAWLNILCHLAAVYPVILFAVLAVNDFAASAEPHSISAPIERVYKSRRYRSQRVTRRVYRSVPYTAYTLDLAMPDGKTRSFDVPYATYKAATAGDTADIPVVRGALGMTTMTRLDNSDIRLRHPKPAPKHRCKFFGTSNSNH